MQAQSTVSRPCGRLAVQLPRTPCHVFRSATTSSRAVGRPSPSKLQVAAQAVEGEYRIGKINKILPENLPLLSWPLLQNT